MTRARGGRAATLAGVALAVWVGACGHDGGAGVGGGAHAPAPVDAVRNAILESLALRPGMVVAEIGLGRGWFVSRAAQAVGRTGAVYATDLDPEAIRFMQGVVPQMDPAAAPVTLRLCAGPRDTGLDDVPDGHLDVILMVDSLCFDGAYASREEDVAYLRRFRRMLAPGGRLVHHMDCTCSTSPEAVEQLFADAGFDRHVERVHVPAVRPPPGWSCRTAEARARNAYVPVFRSPPP